MTGRHAHRPVQRPAIAAFLLLGLALMVVLAAYYPPPAPAPTTQAAP